MARVLSKLMALPDDAETEEAREEWRETGLAGRAHTRERDMQAVRYHYDVGNDFYALWLDSRMVYSCGYFQREDASLDEAQTAKLEHICRKLRLKPGERLLDIGCGWGGLVMYAAEHYGVHATGITLSDAQATLARERVREAGLSNRCQIEVRDYREMPRGVHFDKIVSVGMHEHVGEAHLPEYFGHAYRLLKPGGLFLNHGIVDLNARPNPIESWLKKHIWQEGSFLDRYIFPDGELIPPGRVIEYAEQAGFETRDVESLREHYALTLRHWVRRLEAHHDDAVRLVGEKGYRAWRLYMAGSAHGFAAGKIGIVQTLLSKHTKGGGSGLPLTREDLYS
jgi:cyclopropane-fatty-acyl-phospholipid synthase